MKQAIFAYVNHEQICSWNQPVLSNKGKVACSRKQWEPFMGFKLITDRYPPITSQMRYPLCQATPVRVGIPSLLIYVLCRYFIYIRNLDIICMLCIFRLVCGIILLDLKYVNNNFPKWIWAYHSSQLSFCSTSSHLLTSFYFSHS